jgi:hypothetical protein
LLVCVRPIDVWLVLFLKSPPEPVHFPLNFCLASTTDHLVACLRIRAGAIRAHEVTPSLSERMRAALRPRALGPVALNEAVLRGSAAPTSRRERETRDVRRSSRRR